jgi:hypothetical protein
MKYKRAFDKFLKHNDVYDRFYRNFFSPDGIAWRKMNEYDRDSIEYFRTINTESWIVNAFSWGMDAYLIEWEDLSQEWSNMYYGTPVFIEESEFYSLDTLSKNIKTI